MIAEGFDPDFSAAVMLLLLQSAIIPPSIPLLSMDRWPVFRLGRFLLESYPGTIMGLSMLPVVYVIARKRSYKIYKRATLGTWRAIQSAFLPL